MSPGNTRARKTDKAPSGPAGIPDRAVLDAIPEVVFVIDRNFRIIDANEAFERTFGISREESVGKSCHEVSHDQREKCAPPAHLCPFDQILSTRKPLVTLHTHYDSSGNKQYVELSAGPILDENDEVVAIVEVVRDVTHRLSTNEALQRSIEDLERICSELNSYLKR